MWYNTRNRRPSPRAAQRRRVRLCLESLEGRAVPSQGQRSLNRCSSKDFQHVVLVPTAAATFHDETRAVRILLQE
jgi:hypothetical protein